jgi:hypothetical protein
MNEGKNQLRESEVKVYSRINFVASCDWERGCGKMYWRAHERKYIGIKMLS